MDQTQIVGRKLGLMYASDYGYAVSDECTQKLINYNDMQHVKTITGYII